MLKVGNNVKMLSFARVSDRPGLVDDYERIKTSFRNPLFRASRMRALIREEPWHAGMIGLFAEYPWPFFIEGEDTPKYLPRFGRDAKDQFRAFHKDVCDMKLDEMNEEDRLKHLGVIIQRLVYRYVEGRAEAKTGKKVKDFQVMKGDDGKERRNYPKEFREAEQRVCSDAFLAMRSRHDQDFVEFFAGSVCSVAQFLRQDEYQFLIQTLMTKPDPNPVGRKGLSWEDVKAIAMIAVSACSFQVRPRDAETQGSPS
jgi:CRISPR-associated protein Cmx8